MRMVARNFFCATICCSTVDAASSSSPLSLALVRKRIHLNCPTPYSLLPRLFRLPLHCIVLLVLDLPREERELLRDGPYLIQRCRFVDHAVLHDVLDLRRVVDVRERIGVEHDEIGELA